MSKSNLVTVDDDAGLGPFMRALSPEHRRFIRELWERNGNQTEAYSLVYPEASYDSAKVGGYRLAHRQDIQNAIHEEEAKHIKLAAGRAIQIARAIMEDPKVKPEVRAKIAFGIIDRAGHSAIAQSHIVVEHVDDRETKEIVRAAVEYARQLGDKRLAYKLLGDGVPKDVIDAEFVEVAKEPPAPAMSPEVAERRAHENALRRERSNLSPDELAERKRLDRERRRNEATVRYAAARKDIAAKAARGEQLDIVDAVADAEAQLVAAFTDDDDDGSQGLEDILFGSSSDAAADAGELVDTRTFPAWRINK